LEKGSQEKKLGNLWYIPIGGHVYIFLTRKVHSGAQHPGNIVWLPRPVRVLSCEWSDVPVSNHQLVAKLPRMCGFQVTQSKRTGVWSHSPPQMRSRRKVGAPVVDSWWGVCREFFEKPERGPW